MQLHAEDNADTMNLTFVETSNFTATVREYFVNDENYLRFQLAIMADPQHGAVIPGCGGLRKTRWADPRREGQPRGSPRNLLACAGGQPRPARGHVR